MTIPLLALPVPQLSPWSLGASLYVPATRCDLLSLGLGKIPRLSSLIYCTEDAVREEDVPLALAHLRAALPELAQQSTPDAPLRFIRVRHAQLLSELAELDLSAIHGLVLPKIDASTLGTYRAVLTQPEFQHLTLMLTLETAQALSEQRMLLLRDKILDEGWAERLLSLRIGGNDLMQALGVRRTPGRTLYEGPLERVISLLVGLFKPEGLSLSSPVYEVYSDLSTLAREVQQDLEYGLCGKTIIHPHQLDTVLEAYRVPERDYLEAQAIVQPDAPAVFSMHGRMCEPATHRRWAGDLLLRAQQYGVRPELEHPAERLPLLG